MTRLTDPRWIALALTVAGANAIQTAVVWAVLFRRRRGRRRMRWRRSIRNNAT